VKNLFSLLFFVLFLTSVVFGYTRLEDGLPQRLPAVKARLCGKEFNVMLARTEIEKAKGLMFYKYLPADQGMLFIYSKPQYMSFWMKNTIIPLDAVFFSEDLKVVDWISNMEPGYGRQNKDLPKYESNSKAQYVLELNAKTAENLNIKIGDLLDIPLFCLYSE